MFNVLIVEDCKITSAMIKKIVENALGTNVRVFQAFDVGTATSLINIIKMDLIFEDISLDEPTDGINCLEYIFEQNPQPQATVVVCTSYYDKEIVDQFARFPIDKFMLKPIISEAIQKYVINVYEKHAQALSVMTVGH